MHQEAGLITNITLGLLFAFGGGLLARWLRLPLIVGYFLAGLLVGPVSPIFHADVSLASQFAEIGVILLMFGVGIQFSLHDLLSVRWIAVPGAVIQSAVATGLGILVAYALGWSFGAGLILGLSISVASTVVLVRALMERNALQSVEGKVAVGWLVVEDLFTVLILVLLPALALAMGVGEVAFQDPLRGIPLLFELAFTLGKVALFALLMFFIGARMVPWLLGRVEDTGSRELFTIGVLAIALGIALAAAAVFGLSMALGAFLAGVVVGGSSLSGRAATDAVPLRDAFAALFFVSAGMLFDPTVVTSTIGPMLAILAIILLAKPAIAFVIVAVFGYPLRTGLTVAAGLAQIGEFSFILAALGRQMGMLPGEGYNLVVGGALLSIAVNPLWFRAIGYIEGWLAKRPRVLALLERPQRQKVKAPVVAGHESA